jgi:hypothetical protein
MRTLLCREFVVHKRFSRSAINASAKSNIFSAAA